MSLGLIASIVSHVISLDAAGIAVTAVILAYYSTSRASKSYPGSYDPGMSSIFIFNAIHLMTFLSWC